MSAYDQPGRGQRTNEAWIFFSHRRMQERCGKGSILFSRLPLTPCANNLRVKPDENVHTCVSVKQWRSNEMSSDDLRMRNDWW